MGDRLNGRTYLNLLTLDNTHLCFFDLQVHPEHQPGDRHRPARRGGRRGLFLEGRYRVVGGVRPVRLDGQVLAFSRATGFTEAIDEGIKIVDLVETEPTWEMLAKEAAARSEGYRLVAWIDAVPADLIDEFCRLNEAFNDEAPAASLEPTRCGDETRVRDGEAQNRKVGRHVFAVAAIASDGTMAGLTEAIVNDHALTRGFQSGTLVLPEHRGHALGPAIRSPTTRRSGRPSSRSARS